MEPETGLEYWAVRVTEELDKVDRTFDPDAVHDLRVALRRCRSMADGFRGVDPDQGWKQLKKLGRDLFHHLGNLRDVQVMEEWLDRLSEPDDPIRHDLLRFFASQEQQLKTNAQVAIQAFQRTRWDVLSHRLAARTKAIPAEGLVFQHMALENWQRAHELHRQALRNRSQVALHRLRIGLKKFRYTVENFLPRRYATWGVELKELQDLLGDIHDLDVLTSILRVRPYSPEERELWKNRIHNERQHRLDKYRAKMLGRHSLWQVWREDLPHGARLQESALARLRTWGAFLDPDVEHSRHVTQLALQIYDGLVRDRLFRASEKQRVILQAAALLHDVGVAKARRAHQKQSYRLIRKLKAPLGWTALDLRTVGAVARYHRGALPRPEHVCLRRLPSSVRATVIRLAGVLRLANAFDMLHDRKVRALQLERSNGNIVIHGEGYTPSGPIAERVAAARFLLEQSCGMAVLVRPRQSGTVSVPSLESFSGLERSTSRH